MLGKPYITGTRQEDEFRKEYGLLEKGGDEIGVGDGI
jgi:hypothetical protein